jgi:hypothetical protein
MIIIFFSLLVCPVFAQNNSFNQDINGWQNARWGMTEEELTRTFGSSLTKSPQREKQQGKYSDYAVRNYVIGDINFIVSFFMSDLTNKLIEIRMTKQWNPNKPANENEFNNLASLLMNKYGQYSRETNDGHKKNIEWSFPSTSIKLSLFNAGSMGEKFNLLSIWYVSTNSGESNKL